MLILGLIVAYLLIGCAWSIYVTIGFLDTFSSTKEALCCFFCNILFWPLIMILAVAAGKLFKDMGGN